MNLSGFGTEVMEVVEARISFRKLSKAPKNEKINMYISKTHLRLENQNKMERYFYQRHT